MVLASPWAGRTSCVDPASVGRGGNHFFVASCEKAAKQSKNVAEKGSGVRLKEKGISSEEKHDMHVSCYQIVLDHPIS